MAYLGSTPTTQSFISGTDYFNGTGSQTAFTLTRSVASVNDIQAVVNNVVQVPNDAYTLSGTTITFTSAPSSGTNNVYVRYLSTTTQTITPSSGINLSAAIGTAGAPSYSFIGDSNTGIFSPAADTIAFAEGGAEVMRIDSSGNVGIGTSSPTNKLSLATTANGGICLNVASRPHFGATYSSDSLVLGYSVKPNPSTVDGMVGTETNSGGGAPAAILMNSGVIQFHTATSVTSGAAFSSERMRIASDGTISTTIGSTLYGAYPARAWVNFNGTGTPAIRNSRNVSSITDNGTGDYTVNFTTAMPDNEYAVVYGGATDWRTIGADGQANITTSGVRLLTRIPSNANASEVDSVALAVFR